MLISTLDLDDLTMKRLLLAAKKSPEKLRQVIEFMSNPPNIGSITIRYRDGKLHCLEETRQTY